MDCTPREITGQLVQSYHEIGGINRLESANLPSKRTVIDACERLLQLLFPGYHDEEPVPADELEMMTGERIATLVETLEVEVAKTLRLRDNGPGGEGSTGEGERADAGVGAGADSDAGPGNDGTETSGSRRQQARELVCQFLGELPRLRKLLRTDVEAAYEGDPAAKNFDEIILAYPCIEAIAIQRCAHCLYRLDVPLIPRIMTEYAHNITGIDIHPGARIGSHFFIDHGTGVVIGETCVIGDRVKLYHGVTLGARNFPKDENGRVVKGNKRHPNVEDDVVVYPHATVLGGKTTLGAGSTVAANVFLRESVPPGTFVSTVGEKLILFDKATGKKIEAVGEEEEAE